MNRQKFEEQNRDRWMELERLLDQFEQGQTPIDARKLPGLFRQVCSDLSIAQYRMYGMRLCDRLNELVIRGYKHVYRGVNTSAENFIKFVWIRFPQAVRSEWRLFWFCMLMFWGPFFDQKTNKKRLPNEPEQQTGKSGNNISLPREV